jgi:hypothetical protein
MRETFSETEGSFLASKERGTRMETSQPPAFRFASRKRWRPGWSISSRRRMLVSLSYYGVTNLKARLRRTKVLALAEPILPRKDGD